MKLENRFTTTIFFMAFWIILSQGVHGHAEPSSGSVHAATVPDAGCGCINILFTLDPKTGSGVITPNMVSSGDCDIANARVIVVDDNPLNKDTVDCPGVWTYGLFDSANNLICWGKLTAQDISGPLLTEVQGRCGRPVAGSTTNGIQPGALTPIDPATLVWRDTFLSTDVAKVLNNPLSWDGSGPLSSTYPFYAGGVRFDDACHYSLYCDCISNVKTTDQITFYQCNSISTDQVWAKILRTFTATDCKGNASTVTQEIIFIRPALVYNASASEIALRSDACSATSAEMLLDFKKRYFVFKDPYACNGEKYAYFPEALAAGNASKVLENNFSFDVEVNGDFSVCNGRKVLVTVTSFDWCTGGKTPLDTITLQWNDTAAPTVALPSKPVILSTGILDCTASFGIDKAGLSTFFGVQITDNCGQTTVSTRIESCADSLVLGIPVAGKAWRKTTYRTTLVNGRLIAVGVPVGRHRLILSSYDNCNNQREDTLHFVVLDKIAPVMKCESQLNVTLSTSSSNQNNLYDPFAIHGYAKVWATEVNKGTSDNCGMRWVRIRRAYSPSNLAAFITLGYDSDSDGDIDTNDGVDWNASGVIGDVEMEKFEYSKINPALLMTPALDYVEFFCGDIGGTGVHVELWGMDRSVSLLGCDFPSEVGGVAYPVISGGNTSYCWQTVQVEDKTNPTFELPGTASIYCIDYALTDSLTQRRTIGWNSPAYQFIEKEIFGAQDLGRFEILSGDDCQGMDVEVEIVPNLTCQSGQVSLIYTARKTINGKLQTYSAGTAYIDIVPVHGYNIYFPGDVYEECVDVRDTANVIGAESSGGCDAFGVYVEDKLYSGTVPNGTAVAACYRVFRTFTVINWCQYTEACGDFSPWAVVVPRDPAGDGMDGVQVLVRDEYVQGRVVNGKEPVGRDGVGELYFEDRIDASLGADGFSSGSLAVGVNGKPESFERINPTNGTEGRQGDYTLNNAFTASYPKQGASSSSSVKSNVPVNFNNAQDVNCSDADSYFAFSYTQIIYVEDSYAPEIEDAGELTFYQDKQTCSADVSFDFSALDACSAPEILQSSETPIDIAIQRVQIRLEGDLVKEISTVNGTVSLVAVFSEDGLRTVWNFRAPALPPGKHSLVVVARDNCGNISAQREIPFEVLDNSGTAPACFHGLSTTLIRNPVTLTGEAVIWATDFIASPVDDCNGQGPELGPSGKKLLKRYYIVRDNGDGIWDEQDGLDDAGFPLKKQTSVVLTCDDLQKTVVLVRIFTEDTLGNLAFCNTHVLLTDPSNACLSPTASAVIGGAISTETQAFVQGVQVTLSGPQNMTYLTDANGAYKFADLPKGKNYTITPFLDDNHRNGVSTFDMVLISKHILGVQPLNSPYKIIAADINNSKSVTTLDLIHLRKLILGIDVKFSNSTGWRFVPKNVTFVNPLNPWQTPFSSSVQIDALSSDTITPFVAIKIGDVNGNAVAGATVRNNGTLSLNVREEMLITGNTYRIPIFASTVDLEGMQFTLGLDPLAVDLVNMEFGIVKEEHVGVFINEGLISASWNKTMRAHTSSDTLFTLVLKAKADIPLSKVLQLNSRIAAPEAYRENEDFLGMELKFDLPATSDSAGRKFELLQNIPNPFYTETSIRFYLPEAGEATLLIQDVTGRVLHTIQGDFQEGYNMVVLQAGNINASGVLYYTLKSGNQMATRKMILLE